MTEILVWYAVLIVLGGTFMLGFAIGGLVNEHHCARDIFDAYERTRRGM